MYSLPKPGSFGLYFPTFESIKVLEFKDVLLQCQGDQITSLYIISKKAFFNFQDIGVCVLVCVCKGPQPHPEIANHAVFFDKLFSR